MADRDRFTFVVQNSGARRDIAAAVRDGIPVEQLAEEFSISVSTVRAYARQWESAARKVQRLTDFEREAIREGCRRGARKRWERTYGAEVVRELLGDD